MKTMLNDHQFTLFLSIAIIFQFLGGGWCAMALSGASMAFAQEIGLGCVILALGGIFMMVAALVAPRRTRTRRRASRINE